MYRKNIKAYTTQSLQAEMAVADPYRVIQLMMQGCIERVAQAKGAIERRDFENKSIAISKSMALLNGLQDALDLSYGKVPEDLFSLYDYMKQRLLDSSRNMDVVPLDEVSTLMITIKSGWDAIPEKERKQALENKATI
ncbi:flagellar export chaperone FliS [Aeromonas caviae]|uniref:flagellar export chaperone FliS n=1 Tax=Aeromonas TaxID=642 RepID=UPI000FEBFECD|nr:MULTISPECIES: flagellar export chaperone FliS [Aeromonas]MBP4040759.1 flagellar export chaperone FliS [Aeromonas sp. SrichE-2G]MCO4202472.1 flagellar export chaperone FliS [Aeromonas taiwanensis]MCR3936897.1 flagellar export chaperone FliS [Aeromonas caviae]MCR3948525.1 flagellar export chaperone FliS [Aeromonas caviae]MDX7716902.1 flagellar export chaperone FliS [Aeromonas caviae]